MAFLQFNQTLSGFIPGAQTNVSGKLSQTAAAPFTIEASIQPASGNDLELLPEGRRVDSTYIVFSKDEIQENWRLTLFGQDFTCIKVEVWRNEVIPHYKGFFQKTDIV